MLRKCSEVVYQRMFQRWDCTEIPDGLFIGTAYVLLHRNARRFIVTKNTHEPLHVQAYEGVPEAMVPGTIEAGVALRG